MNEPDPIGTDARRAERERRLGPDACCVRCGFTEPAGLVRKGPGLFEKHHVVGRANDPSFTQTLCIRCHRVATAKYQDYGVDMGPSANTVERTTACLRGLGAALQEMSQACFRWADKLAHAEQQNSEKS